MNNLRNKTMTIGRQTIISTLVVVLAACNAPEAISTTTEAPTSQPTVIPILPAITPTPGCGHFFDSGMPIPTSTPTWIEYRTSSGELLATISRQIDYDDYQSYCLDMPSTDILVSIWRDGINYEISASNIAKASPEISSLWSSGGLLGARISLIQDLDYDGENEYVFYIDLRGASCCTGVSIVYYDPAKNEYKTTNSVWRKYTLYPRLNDIDSDGIPEFETVDVGFNQAVGGVTAENAIAPIRIYKYISRSIVDVTSLYSARVEQDARSWLDYFSKADLNDPHIQKLALAAYLADMYVLGKGAEENNVFDEMCNFKFDTESCLDYRNKVIEIIKTMGYEPNQ